ncbi:unnamed protein product, partial [Prorocentrum cordatum]
ERALKGYLEALSSSERRRCGAIRGFAEQFDEVGQSSGLVWSLEGATLSVRLQEEAKKFTTRLLEEVRCGEDFAAVLRALQQLEAGQAGGFFWKGTSFIRPWRTGLRLLPGADPRDAPLRQTVPLGARRQQVAQDADVAAARLSGAELRPSLALHEQVGADRWGITKTDLHRLRREVEAAVATGNIVRTSRDMFDPADSAVGPNIYTVIDQLIKPMTRLAYLAYAWGKEIFTAWTPLCAKAAIKAGGQTNPVSA